MIVCEVGPTLDDLSHELCDVLQTGVFLLLMIEFLLELLEIDDLGCGHVMGLAEDCLVALVYHLAEFVKDLVVDFC